MRCALEKSFFGWTLCLALPLLQSTISHAQTAAPQAPQPKLNSDGQTEKPLEGTPEKPLEKPLEKVPARPKARESGGHGKKSRNAAPVPAPETAPASPSAWFPDWGQKDFDWFVRPLVGIQYTDEKQDGLRTRSSALEFGVQGGLMGVPLKTGNPGLQLEPSAGYSYGNVTQKTDGQSAVTGAYHRNTLGLGLPVNLGFYKVTPRIVAGQIQGKLTPRRRSFELSLDQGILLRSFLSTHLTTTWLRLTGTEWSTAHLNSLDVWWSIRAFTSVAQAQVAFGPGITWSDLKSYDGKTEVAKVALRSTDLRLLASSHLFWKLGASLNSKYTITSTAELGQSLGNGPLPDLPSQNLGESSRIVTREKDSFASTAFLGLSNVFMGMGFGYFHSIFVESMSGGGPKGTTRGKTTQSSGVGAHYSAQL